MRKTLFALGLILSLIPAVRAQQLTNAQAVKIVVPYKTACSSVTIGTAATEMTGNTSSAITTAGISALKVSNLSTTATVCCASANTVVCTVGNSNYIEPIFPSSAQPNFDEWGISTMQPWYCAASAANTSLSVCLVR